MSSIVREPGLGTPNPASSAWALTVSAGRIAPQQNALAAWLLARDGSRMGLLLVAAMPDSTFSDDDAAMLVQLAQMEATAVENTLFAEAREANRLKDEFLATLSHELRTPLSAILGWSQLLRTQMLDAEETAEALEIIERNGEMQHKLVEDLLDVSRIVTGKMQLSLRPISLTAVIRAAVDVMLPAAQARQISITLTLDDNADEVVGDPDRLQQVVWNLLSNAVKFTPAQGSIEVRLQRERGHARLTVRDTGEGIAPEFLPHVFERFRQADSSTSRRHGGLGIGLAIVRHVIELHGGSVRAESNGKGQGTKMILTLPLAAAPRIEVAHRTLAEAKESDRVAAHEPLQIGSS
jgi:signal transduction histidine kinase